MLLTAASSRSTDTTESALLKATYSKTSWGLNTIAVGCELGTMESAAFARSIQRATLPVSRFSSATEDPFHKLTHAWVPALLAITVYGKALGMYRLRLRSTTFSIFQETAARRTA